MAGNTIALLLSTSTADGYLLTESLQTLQQIGMLPIRNTSDIVNMTESSSSLFKMKSVPQSTFKVYTRE
jgi:hypothetical protein